MTTTAAFLEYSDGEHRYFANGRELPSVTQVLDAAGKISPFCKDEEARFRGSKVHEICAEDDDRRLDMRKVPAAFRGYLRAWRAFRIDTGFMPVLIEHRVDSLEHGFAGRFDRLGALPGRSLMTLVDIKTSKSGDVPEYSRLQLSAYALAHRPKQIFDRMVVVLMPSGRYNTRTWHLEQFYRDRNEWIELLKKVKGEKNGHQ